MNKWRPWQIGYKLTLPGYYFETRSKIVKVQEVPLGPLGLLISTTQLSILQTSRSKVNVKVKCHVTSTRRPLESRTSRRSPAHHCACAISLFVSLPRIGKEVDKHYCACTMLHFSICLPVNIGYIYQDKQHVLHPCLGRRPFWFLSNVCDEYI